MLEGEIMSRGSKEQKNEKIIRVLELQGQGITYKSMSEQECAELLGYKQKKAVHNLMRRAGYKYDKQKGIFLGTDENMTTSDNITDDVTTSDVITNDETEVVLSDKHQTNITQDNSESKEKSISALSDKYQINITAEKMQRIDKMLEWFESIQSIEPISNELVFNVKAPNKSEDRKTIYIDKELWDRLDNFYQSHRQYKKNDLINQAIYEYLEKIENLIK